MLVHLEVFLCIYFNYILVMSVCNLLCPWSDVGEVQFCVFFFMCSSDGDTKQMSSDSDSESN